jgi:large conductance mechanosensitive channel
MKKFLNEFKEFALKGNAVNLAVGVIIGAAFQNVVKSLTDNILSPVIGLFTGQNFDSLHFSFIGVTIMYGAFITSIINFLIMAFVVFCIVKIMSKIGTIVKTDDSDPGPATIKCPYCQTEISGMATRCPACTSQIEEIQADASNP